MGCIVAYSMIVINADVYCDVRLGLETSAMDMKSDTSAARGLLCLVHSSASLRELGPEARVSTLTHSTSYFFSLRGSWHTLCDNMLDYNYHAYHQSTILPPMTASFLHRRTRSSMIPRLSSSDVKFYLFERLLLYALMYAIYNHNHREI